MVGAVVAGLERDASTRPKRATRGMPSRAGPPRGGSNHSTPVPVTDATLPMVQASIGLPKRRASHINAGVARGVSGLSPKLKESPVGPSMCRRNSPVRAKPGDAPRPKSCPKALSSVAQRKTAYCVA